MSQAITTSARRMLPSRNWGSTIRKLVLWTHAIVASAKSIVPPAAWDRGRDGVVSWVKDRELAWAKSTLEQRLARIIETANGHQAKGLPSGSPAYAALYEHANSSIDDFCARHAVERLAVEQEVPVLRELEALTHAPSPVARLAKGLGILVAGVIGAIVVGCAGGLASAGYHWVERLLSR